MVSTVTSATVATITSATMTGVAGLLALIAVLAFMALLIQKELVSNGASRWSVSLSRGLNIGLVPLGLAFVLIVAAQVFRVIF